MLPDGREVCLTPGAWKRRKEAVRVRDMGVCQVAVLVGREPHMVRAGAWTADHIKKRGLSGATRDDRMENLRLTCDGPGSCHALAHDTNIHQHPNAKDTDHE